MGAPAMLPEIRINRREVPPLRGPTRSRERKRRKGVDRFGRNDSAFEIEIGPGKGAGATTAAWTARGVIGGVGGVVKAAPGGAALHMVWVNGLG